MYLTRSNYDFYAAKIQNILDSNTFFYFPLLWSAPIHQRDIFLDDLRDCTLVDPAEWEQRPAWHKFRQSFSRMLTPIL